MSFIGKYFRKIINIKNNTGSNDGHVNFVVVLIILVIFLNVVLHYYLNYLLKLICRLLYLFKLLFSVDIIFNVLYDTHEYCITCGGFSCPLCYGPYSNNSNDVNNNHLLLYSFLKVERYFINRQK